MSYSYLMEAYAYLRKRIDDAEKQLLENGEIESTRRFLSGRLDILHEVEQFLVLNYDSKLPRRLRKSGMRQVRSGS